jgi:hypothetical protein
LEFEDTGLELDAKNSISDTHELANTDELPLAELSSHDSGT